ncbi:preprotein translocase subunit SecE [Chlamydiifrater phoenicopteri]|uniref:preprotein translocase subunit SecE n=1 Tax=Chlamydiifrater phoenicopteri TaxID=2681469 RepID=UPI001BCCD55E|nr:preprotein translocase subunit SecE [Chlamydiifrater phoenicopteri]
MKQGQKNAKSRAAALKKASQFAGSFSDEIKKIEWTSKKDLKRYLKIILASVFSCGLAVYLIDITIRRVLVAIGELVKVIFG